MFSIKIDRDVEEDQGKMYVEVDITLKYENEDITYEFIPEYTDWIKKADLDKIKSFDTRPANGNFSLDWNEEKIVFCVSKSGDGNGGDSKLEIKSTPEKLESLLQCLRKWKEAFN